MKKYLIAGAALVASLPSSVFADNFNAPYAGLTFGANAFQSRYTQTAPRSSGSATVSPSAVFFNYGLFAGYGHTMGQFYAGGELLLAMQTGQAKNFSTAGDNTSNSYATVKERFSMNPALRLGALISPKTLAFIKLGMVGTQLEVAATPLDNTTPTTKYKKTLWGYSFGAGVESLITDKVSIRADYTCNIYPTKTFTITNPGENNQGKISPQDNIFRVGAAYHFSF